jgi:Mg/Co/Ni transporter MgtE
MELVEEGHAEEALVGGRTESKTHEELCVRVAELENEVQRLSREGMIDDQQGRSYRLMTSLLDRGTWLIGLLVLQSISSLVLQKHQSLILKHPAIFYFMTMLVGAGGNAGNQASVIIIRKLALSHGKFDRFRVLKSEMIHAVALSLCLGLFGMLRVVLSSDTDFAEIVVITCSLMVITFISVCIGSVLPILMQIMGLDPAHSSTTIQVVMDVLGVVITVSASNFFLNTRLGSALIDMLGSTSVV